MARQVDFHQVVTVQADAAQNHGRDGLEFGVGGEQLAVAQALAAEPVIFSMSIRSHSWSR